MASSPSTRLFDVSFAASAEQGKAPPERCDIVKQGPSATCFKIGHFFSDREVAELVQQTEKMPFCDLDTEYPQEYRHCMRCLCRSDDLAVAVWQRLVPFLQATDLDGARPRYMGGEGYWVATGINPCFRVSKYAGSGHFKRHTDGGFDIDSDNRSIFTVMAYLTDDFVGGETVIYEPDGPAHKIMPQTGTLVVFNHDLEHEALPVSGIKLIFRTDIIFRRIGGALVGSDALRDHPQFQHAEHLYAECARKHKLGDAHGSTEAFREAERVHQQQQPRAPMQNVDVVPPVVDQNILGHITPFLFGSGIQDAQSGLRGLVSLLLACRGSFTSISRDNTLWRIFHTQQWPELVTKETLQVLPPDRRWFHFFRSRWLAQRDFQVLFLHVGIEHTWFGLMGEEQLGPSSELPVGCAPSALRAEYHRGYAGSRLGLRGFMIPTEGSASEVVAQVPLQVWEDQWDEDDIRYPWQTCHNGDYTLDPPYVRWLAKTILQNGGSKPKNPRIHPVLVAVPSRTGMRKQIIEELTEEQDQSSSHWNKPQNVCAPYVAVVEVEELVARWLQQPNCIVLYRHLDSGSTAVTPVVGYRAMGDISIEIGTRGRASQNPTKTQKERFRTESARAAQSTHANWLEAESGAIGASLQALSGDAQVACRTSRTTIIVVSPSELRVDEQLEMHAQFAEAAEANSPKIYFHTHADIIRAADALCSVPQARELLGFVSSRSPAQPPFESCSGCELRVPKTQLTLSNCWAERVRRCQSCVSRVCLTHRTKHNAPAEHHPSEKQKCPACSAQTYLVCVPRTTGLGLVCLRCRWN